MNLNANGFTLLEIMIALVIFSIGLLGLAGLQGASMQNNQIAYSKTIATQYAYDLADRMRNNPMGDYTTTVPTTAPSKTCITSSSNCSPSELANVDLWEWSQAIKHKNSTLANPQIFITQSSGNYTIAIGWNAERANITGTYDCTATPPTPAGVDCVSITVTP